MRGEHRITGHLAVKERKSGLRWHLWWRDADGAHQKVLGPAWVKPKKVKGDEHADIRAKTRRAGLRSWSYYWRAADGPAPDGFLSGKDAEAEAKKILDAAPRQRTEPVVQGAVTFADVAAQYLDYAEHTQRVKPATLREYRRLLAMPGERKRGNAENAARIMRTFADRPVDEITVAEIKDFLRELDRKLNPRNVNWHRQALANVFEYAVSEDSIPVEINPVRAAKKRREDYSKPPQTFTAEEVSALARAAREGKHRRPRVGETPSDAERAQRAYEDRQDAALYMVAAYTGLRQGELRALRWRDVRFEDRAIIVVAGMSAGQRSETKSRKWRAVPLPREAFVALDELSKREFFTDSDDPVFCGTTGQVLDESALRRRYTRTRDAAGIPKLPFHHLRHTYATLTIRAVDPATVQALLGHSELRTTERYLQPGR